MTGLKREDGLLGLMLMISVAFVISYVVLILKSNNDAHCALHPNAGRQGWSMKVRVFPPGMTCRFHDGSTAEFGPFD